MGSHRPERVAHLLQVELGDLLLREARDPGLRLVTITEVRITPDLHHARVFFRTLDERGRGDAERGLARAQPFLRSALGRRLGLRVTPELAFEWDTVADIARRVEGVLRTLESDAQDATEHEAPGGEDDDDETPP